MNRLMVVMALLVLASTCYGQNRIVAKPFWDRFGEYDLVVVGTLTGPSVAENPDTTDGRKFAAVGELQVEEVLWDPRGVRPDSLTVALAGRTALKNLATLHVQEAPKTRSLWLLQTSDSQTPAPYTVVARTLPDKPENWGPYLAHIRERAKSFRAWSRLRLGLFVEPASIANRVPGMATVWLYHEGDGKGEYPSGFLWSRNIVMALEPNKDCYESDKLSPYAAPPALRLLNARPLTKPKVPGEIQAGTIHAARLLLMPSDIRMEEGKKQVFWCRAHLLDDERRILVSSPRVPLIANEPVLAEADLKAYQDIESANLWCAAGPHPEKLSPQQVQTFQGLYETHKESFYGPALRCGLVFAGVPLDVRERMAVLGKLAAEGRFGFGDDCRFELAKLYVNQGQQALARERIYPRLVEGESAVAWRAAIAVTDPDWK